ncbi:MULTISPECIES: glycosyltransferase family 4 protein [unclassified Cupriavidus]|uniref:glycosyltransferase family 4 protein n=1 Tax=unclassified Cupriavidus TaxID=2640874 RepID=UPI00048C340F|nr:MULTISPECIES: glycosyltransferase family 4 protein [unclassified Cupriavidus]MBP0633989.1 glycosyltransferase family 4 protein [Cupriavidus sp. AcVe19-6a]
MRVLHVFKTYYPDSFGGVEQVIRQIILSARPLGVEGRVFTLSKSTRQVRRVRDGEIEVIQAPTNLDVASTPFSLSALKPFKDASKWADVIHYHFPWPFGDMLHLLGRPRRPSLLTYHSDIVRQRTLLHFYRPLMRRFIGSMDAVVATSPNYVETSETLQEFRDKVSVVPIGLNEASYPTVKSERVAYWKDRVGNRFFLFVGVIRYYKGLHILLNAIQGAPFHVVIVGAGPIELQLRKQAESLGLDNVHFLGALPDEDKMALLSLCHAVVFPSHLRSEAYGVTLLEGAMNSKPLISSEIGTGSSFINIDGETGLVVPPGDPAAFRKAMERLYEDDALAAIMGAQARQRFESEFTAEKMAASYVELYRRIVQVDGAICRRKF